MKRHVSAAVFLLCGVPLVAQGDAPAAAAQDPQAAYAELVRAFQNARNEYHEAFQKRVDAAQKEGKRMPRSAYKPPTGEYVGRAQEYAKQYAGTDDAVRFLGFILKNAYSERNAVRWAAETLASDHFDGDAIVDLVDYLPMAERLGGRAVRTLLDRIADKHPKPDIRAKGLLARAGAMMQKDASAAVPDLEKVLTLTEDEDLLAEANDALTEARKFAIGATAPEIVGVDVEGTAFKLSDYRGKVVLLDFWGFW